MTLYFCDVCGKQVKRLNTFSFPCHLNPSSKDGMGYVDNDFNAVSGRDDSIDICNKCSNEMYSAAIQKWLSIKAASSGQE
jgi:hypothetical protein